MKDEITIITKKEFCNELSNILNAERNETKWIIFAIHNLDYYEKQKDIFYLGFSTDEKNSFYLVKENVEYNCILSNECLSEFDLSLYEEYDELYNEIVNDILVSLD